MSQPIVDEQFKRLAEGYSITTAEILYGMPDYRHIVQQYIWQDYDLAPEFPNLMGFLKFWAQELEGPLIKVRVAHSKLIKVAEFKPINGVIHIH